MCGVSTSCNWNIIRTVDIIKISSKAVRIDGVTLPIYRAVAGCGINRVASIVLRVILCCSAVSKNSRKRAKASRLYHFLPSQKSTILTVTAKQVSRFSLSTKSLPFLLERKAIMISTSWEALYQQNPVLAEGDLHSRTAGRVSWLS